MRVVIARTMAEFSMDAYATGLVEGLRAVRPSWDIVDLKPHSVDRNSGSVWVRAHKAYERFWNFPKTIQRQQADIYHIIDPAEAHAVYRLRRKSGQKVVVTCHDLINFHNQYNLQGSIQLPLVSRRLWLWAVHGMKQADHVVSVSTATAQETTKLLEIPSTHITVTPNGVDPLFQPITNDVVTSIRQRHGMATDTLCLLNVGSNHPRKNILIVLKAVRKLKQQGLPVCFWKVSADFTDEQKTYIQEHNLESSVVYLGKPAPEDLVELYGAADILIAPSLLEGFGLTILEAMATGTPVITSNVSAMPEVAGDAAILVNPSQADEIASAVQTLYHDSNYRNTLIERGLKRAQQFTWQATAEKVAQVYESLFAKNNNLPLSISSS
ncbi:glycosyltransferase family 4 protein [Leptothoe spongobia]|uniref:Glycosyltransferase family 4 protein n=1 Tax=Leptothoe spongobia TAU-MAC 1115 TaxID=1967444 RepID=A0A947DD20_9CYAN|nr:glycosyltransferase family 1 protein [Leptothoe spongobia]MBT9314738.1 glycosyltransferase family 4 protein [Leptothoe spongobia TAU-MAC 1115]